MPFFRSLRCGWLLALACTLPALAGTSTATRPVAPASAQASPAVPAAPASAPAAGEAVDASQRAFGRARDKLLQVRTLLRGQDSQASVGSGFLVSDQGHLITNFHVVSQFALRPAQHRLVYVTADGRQGALQLLGVDVVHDLALLRVADPGALAGRGPLVFRPGDEPLQRGERLHALGHPLDVGFAVVGGSYNGLVERSFLPTIFFGGSLSAGMSGGPTLDERGRVIGVNVATRRDGEQVSFLVPASFAAALLERSRQATPLLQPIYPQLQEQLQAHQAALVERFLALPWRPSGHVHWQVPVPREDFMRCWGRNTAAEGRGLQFERSDCAMDSRVYVSGALQLGHLQVQHEVYDSRRLGVLRFQERYSRSFGNESFGSDTRQQTAPQCHERYVRGAGAPVRAVLCLRGYKKLPGLYEMSLLVTVIEGLDTGVQGRFNAFGVSLANAQRLAAHYLGAFGVNAPASRP